MDKSTAYQLGYKFAKLGYPSTYTGNPLYAGSFYKGHDTANKERLTKC